MKVLPTILHLLLVLWVFSVLISFVGIPFSGQLFMACTILLGMYFLVLDVLKSTITLFIGEKS